MEKLTARELTSYKFACIIARFLDEKIAKDITILNISNVSSFADYFVICSGNSTTQIKALADEVEFVLKRDNGIMADHVEGRSGDRWILVDYKDVVVHIFHPEERANYNIEKLWETKSKEAQ